MTAYRYVRTARLPAVKQGGRWWVTKEDLAAIINAPTGQTVAPRPRASLAEPLAARLAKSDLQGSWQIVEGVLASGATPTEVHEDVIGPAMWLIGEQWRSGELSIADEHRATATTQRIIGRMAPMFRPAGRRRGSVVLGAVAGDTHGLPSAMLADMLESVHLSVIDLGSNTPTESFLMVAHEVDDLVGVGVVTALPSLVNEAAATARALRQALPGALIILGGSGLSDVPDDQHNDSAHIVTCTAAEARAGFTRAAASRTTRASGAKLESKPVG